MHVYFLVFSKKKLHLQILTQNRAHGQQKPNKIANCASNPENRACNPEVSESLLPSLATTTWRGSAQLVAAGHFHTIMSSTLGEVRTARHLYVSGNTSARSKLVSSTCI
jgi:hypothetical protein